jgi:transposase
LWLEIQQQGYTGTLSSTRRALAKFPVPDSAKRNEAGLPTLTPLPKLELRLRPLSAKRAAWLLLHEDKKLKLEDLLARQVLLELDPPALAVRELAQGFKKVLRERKVAALDEWLLLAEQSGIGEFERFAGSLKRDYAAVSAGVELQTSNGQTEGQVNRLKWLKRAMFGRAKFDLLTRRVLHRRAG